MDLFQYFRLTSSENVEIFQALGLLLLFDEKRSEMNTKQILERTNNGYIPAILYSLQLLETRNLLKKTISCGKIAWRITPLGCNKRDKIKEIILWR